MGVCVCVFFFLILVYPIFAPLLHLFGEMARNNLYSVDLAIEPQLKKNSMKRLILSFGLKIVHQEKSTYSLYFVICRKSVML